MEPRSNLIHEKIAAHITSLNKFKFMEEDTQEELENHLQEHIEEQMNQGISEEVAVNTAFLQLGDLHSLASEYKKRIWLSVLIGGIFRGIVFSKRVVAFVLLFIGLTFGSIFAERPRFIRLKPNSFQQKDSIQAENFKVNK